MTVRLKAAMEEFLAEWPADLTEPWRSFLGNVTLDFDGISPELELEIWEPIFPVRRGKHFPGMPQGTHCLRAFDGILPDSVRCVVLGQDPYPEPGFATGRAFEAGNLAGWNELDKMFSKSIRAYTQQIIAARTGDLSYARSFADWPKTLDAIENGAVELEQPSEIADRWVNEGALLLNASLTLTRFKVDIDPHQSQGHLVLWRPLIVKTLRLLAARGKPLVFLGFGDAAAQALKLAGIDETIGGNMRCVLREHPARADEVLALPNPFILCNNFLEEMGSEPSLGNMAATKTFDYIIIGAGSAGCVLANRLSADPANKVLLLEAGGRDLNPLFRLPMLMGKLFHSGIYNWHYHTEPEPHLNGRSLYWPRGKVLGGTSTINGMIYVRGNRHDYDRWAQMGANGWSYDEVLPAFLRSETHVQRKDAFHSTEGELTVCRARGWNGLLNVFNEAGEQAGYPLNDDFNGADQEGFGRYDFTITKGKRCSTAYAFLRPAKSRPNLTIVTRAHTRRILIENGRAIGVEYARKGNVIKAHAKREVILSAGVVNSPQILMLSGIGAADELTQHNIHVVQDLPGVGKNLQDHVDCVMAYECREPVTLYSDLRADKLTWSVIQGMLFGEGITTTFPYEAGAFVKSRTDLAAPDIQLHFMPALEKTANLHFPNPFKKERVETNHGFSLRVGPVNPESRGEIRLRSADPADRPRINANYLQTEFDIRTMINAVRMTRDIIQQKAFDKYRGEELAPGPAVESDAELIKWLRANAMTTFHPVGTCKMGNDPMSVVDARLKVHGVEGLRVADASIMPIISSGNTNAPAIMIGERAAEFILKEASL